MEKCENQQRSRINKAFKKIPRFDGTNPSYCFDWLEQTEALVNEHHRQIYREELLLNCGTSMSKTIHALPQGAANQSIKDAVLRNTQISGLCRKDQTHIISCTRSPMKRCRVIIPGMSCSLIWHIQS